MKVSFRQTGGFTGLSFGCELDTATMSVQEASELKKLAAASGLCERRERGSEAARDVALYEIVVEDEGGRIAASFDDMTVPREAEGLLDFLRARAGPRPLR